MIDVAKQRRREYLRAAKIEATLRDDQIPSALKGLLPPMGGLIYRDGSTIEIDYLDPKSLTLLNRLDPSEFIGIAGRDVHGRGWHATMDQPDDAVVVTAYAPTLAEVGVRGLAALIEFLGR